MKKKVHSDMVGSWGRSEVGSAPSSNLVRRWGRLVLRPGRSEDGAQHTGFGQKMGQTGLKAGQVRRWGTTYIVHVTTH